MPVATSQIPPEDRWIPVELVLLGSVLEAGGQKTSIQVGCVIGRSR